MWALLYYSAILIIRMGFRTISLYSHPSNIKRPHPAHIEIGFRGVIMVGGGGSGHPGVSEIGSFSIVIDY